MDFSRKNDLKLRFWGVLKTQVPLIWDGGIGCALPNNHARHVYMDGRDHFITVRYRGGKAGDFLIETSSS